MLVHWYDKDKMLNVMLICLGLFYGWVCFLRFTGFAFLVFSVFVFILSYGAGLFIRSHSICGCVRTGHPACLLLYLYPHLIFFYFTEFMPSFMSVSYHRLLSFVYLFVDVE
jgi:hypothetical protein